jgi:hypothetical protein
MKRVARSHAAIVLLASSAVAACGNDATGPDKGALSQALSLEIFSQLFVQVLSVNWTSPAVAPAAAAVGALAADVTPLTISTTVPCSQGGTASVTGTSLYDLNDGTGSISVDVHYAYNNCVVPTSQGSFTVNGNPDLHIALAYSLASWQPVGLYTYTWNGGFRWSGPGGTGNCSVNMSVVHNWGTSTSTMSGTLCGYNIST